MIKFNANKAYGFVSEEAVKGYKQAVAEAQEALHNGTGKGNDFLGWLTLPTDLTDELLADIENVADALRRECEVVVVVGIVCLAVCAVVGVLSQKVSQKK